MKRREVMLAIGLLPCVAAFSSIPKKKIDPIFLSILMNEGPEETFAVDSEGCTHCAPGPLTRVQRDYAMEKLRRDWPRLTYREIYDPEQDIKWRAELEADRIGECRYYINQHPEEFTREARLRRAGYYD